MSNIRISRETQKEIGFYTLRIKNQLADENHDPYEVIQDYQEIVEIYQSIVKSNQ